MKPSAAAKVADKPKAPASKVFDVARPGKTKATATSRPIIVTNRPILQDPMVSSNTVASDVTAAEDRPSPAAIKVTLKPLTPAEEPKSEKQDKSGKGDKTIAELAEEAEKGVDKISLVTKDPPSEEKSDAKPTKDESPKFDDPASEKTESTDTPADKADAVDSVDDSDKPADETVPSDDSKDAKQAAELEAETKKLEEINALVESREYFLPINAVERHRSKVVAVFGLVLILALGALLLDLLLDVGFIRLGGVHSLTHFFSS